LAPLSDYYDKNLRGLGIGNVQTDLCPPARTGVWGQRPQGFMYEYYSFDNNEMMSNSEN